MSRACLRPESRLSLVLMKLLKIAGRRRRALRRGRGGRGLQGAGLSKDVKWKACVRSETTVSESRARVLSSPWGISVAKGRERIYQLSRFGSVGQRQCSPYETQRGGTVVGERYKIGSTGDDDASQFDLRGESWT